MRSSSSLRRCLSPHFRDPLPFLINSSAPPPPLHPIRLSLLPSYSLYFFSSSFLFRLSLYFHQTFSTSSSSSFSSQVIKEMKKIILKVDLYDEKSKKKAMKAVSGIEGVDSISLDTKDKKLTVTGDVDPVVIARKLRKLSRAEILSVGPAKEEKKDAPKKEEPKKEEPKKEDQKKKESEMIEELVKAYKAYNPHLTTHYFVPSAEDNPNACVIC